MTRRQPNPDALLWLALFLGAVVIALSLSCADERPQPEPTPNPAHELGLLRMEFDAHTERMAGEIALLRAELEDARLLAAFGSVSFRFGRVGCDGSLYPAGSNGAAAFRAYELTGLCRPAEELPAPKMTLVRQ